MEQPKRAGDSPIAVNLEEGKDTHGVHVDYRQNNLFATDNIKVENLFLTFLLPKK